MNWKVIVSSINTGLSYYELLLVYCTYGDGVAVVDLDRRVRAQSSRRDVPLEPGVDAPGGQVDGGGGAEREGGHHGVVGAGEVRDLEAVVHHQVHLLVVGRVVLAVAQHAPHGVPELVRGHGVGVVVVDADAASLGQQRVRLGEEGRHAAVRASAGLVGDD